MSSVAISVRNLTKTYKLYDQPIDRLKEALHPFKKTYCKNFTALDDVSFEINRGETVGIIGRNGSGKSTLLKLITGVLTPTSGSAIVHGRVSAILEMGAGFNAEMTGLENIHLNTSINGIPESETEKNVQQIVEFAELGEYLRQPLKTYSSGMKARLAFAVAINVEPDILIVDEALSVGDAAFQRKCFAKMEQIRRAGATILFVSHSEESIVSLCNRAIWLTNGAKVLDGEPKPVTSLYLKHINRPIKKNDVQQEYAKLIAVFDEHANTGAVGHAEKPTHEASKQNATKNDQINLSSFDPSLKPTSTVEYDSKGARIFDVKVTDLEGVEVNILEHGRQYYYNYKVKVTQPLQQVKLGFLVKHKNGSSIGGGAYPSVTENIDHLNKSINVRFKITAILAQGEYFFNAGVQAILNDKQDYVHRILDAYMVKVINQSPNMTAAVKIVEEATYEEW